MTYVIGSLVLAGISFVAGWFLGGNHAAAVAAAKADVQKAQTFVNKL